MGWRAHVNASGGPYYDRYEGIPANVPWAGSAFPYYSMPVRKRDESAQTLGPMHAELHPRRSGDSDVKPRVRVRRVGLDRGAVRRSRKWDAGWQLFGEEFFWKGTEAG